MTVIVIDYVSTIDDRCYFKWLLSWL